MLSGTDGFVRRQSWAAGGEPDFWRNHGHSPGTERTGEQSDDSFERHTISERFGEQPIDGLASRVMKERSGFCELAK